MSIHCVIWGLPRVGSTTLADALGAIAEPFKRHHDWSYATTAEIERLCGTRQSVKHLYGEGPHVNNLTLARAANRNGYRHIHLVRCNEFARLVSLDIAAQQVAWLPETAVGKFAALKAGRAKLAPLNITQLLDVQRIGAARWSALRRHIGTFLTVRFEDITAIERKRRHAALKRIVSFLELPWGALRRLDHAMATGGQDTRAVWDLVPNLSQFRTALGSVL